MNGPPHHWWMYDRLLSNHNGYMQEFLHGINQFDKFARRQIEFTNEGQYRHPYAKCKNRMYLTLNEVHMNLMCKGFVKVYSFWISHREVEP